MKNVKIKTIFIGDACTLITSRGTPKSAEKIIMKMMWLKITYWNKTRWEKIDKEVSRSQKQDICLHKR